MHLKLLLVGESGLGKTTWTDQLVRSYAEGGAPLSRGHDGSSSRMSDFLSNPDSLLTKIGPIRAADGKLNMHISIQVGHYSACVKEGVLTPTRAEGRNV